MVRVLRHWQVREHAPEAPHAIAGIENEIERRQRASLHKQAMEQSGKLLEITDAQKELAQEAAKQAENLSSQTNTLVEETVKLTRFTRGVFWFTIVLGFFAFVQIVIMLIGLLSKNR